MEFDFIIADFDLAGDDTSAHVMMQAREVNPDAIIYLMFGREEDGLRRQLDVPPRGG